MELQRYLEILLKRWSIVVMGVLVTTGLTVVMTADQEPVYQSTASFLVRPSTEDSEEVVRAIGTLMRGGEITTTYATIVGSDNIRERAERRLGPEVDIRGTKVSGSVITGTNVLEVSVTGPDPHVVHALAMAVAEEMRAYIDETQAVFELQPLDPPEVSDEPIGPKRRLTIMFGMVFGLALGALLAVLTEGLLGGRREDHGGSAEPLIIDGPNFHRHFNDELVDALVNHRSFSVAVLKVDVDDSTDLHADGRPAEERINALARERLPSLGEDDVVAYLGDSTFALMLPDTGPAEAEELLQSWNAAISWAADQRLPRTWRAYTTVGVFHYGVSADGNHGALRAVTTDDDAWLRRVGPEFSGGKA